MNKTTVAMLLLMAEGIAVVRGFVMDDVVPVAATNSLETWEGSFSFREAAMLDDVPGVTNMCLCIYGNEGVAGTLLEVYIQGAGGVGKALSAAENAMGVTPVLLQFGVCTNQAEIAFWSRWRHPGNGGFLSHLRYSATNGVLSVSTRHEFCDMGAGKTWHRVEADGRFVAVTNLARIGEITLWTNTNTVYSAVE